MSPVAHRVTVCFGTRGNAAPQAREESNVLRYTSMCLPADAEFGMAERKIFCVLVDARGEAMTN